MKKERKILEDLYNAVNMVNAVYEDWARANGLSSNEQRVFAAYWRKKSDSMTQKELMEMTGEPKTTINSIIKKFLELEYVTLEASEKNRKEKLVVLTDEGRKKKSRLLDSMLKMEEDFVNDENASRIMEATAIQKSFAEYLRNRLLQ